MEIESDDERWKCNVCGAVLPCDEKRHASLLNGEYFDCNGGTMVIGKYNDDVLSDIEILDTISQRIIKKHSDNLHGATRKKQLKQLANRFNSLEKLCNKKIKDK